MTGPGIRVAAAPEALPWHPPAAASRATATAVRLAGAVAEALATALACDIRPAAPDVADIDLLPLLADLLLTADLGGRGSAGHASGIVAARYRARVQAVVDAAARHHWPASPPGAPSRSRWQ